MSAAPAAGRPAPLRLVLMGTGPFGVPTFRRLYGTRHEVAAVVTGAERPPHGRRPPPPSAVRRMAAEMGSPVLDPVNVNEAAAREALAGLQADLLVVCDYGRILSVDTLRAARLGGVNLHGSLLPRYRGAAPIHWALYHGEAETGVSVIHMTPRVDAGPVIAQARTPIRPDETAVELEERLSAMGADLLPAAVEDLLSGAVTPIPQDPALVCKAPRLTKAHGLLDWSRPARALHDHVRAMQPWPGAYTLWRPAEGEEPLRLLLGPLEALATNTGGAAPGTVLEAAGARLVVATGRGACALSTLKPAGKREMRVATFLNGHALHAGAVLG